MNYTDELPTPRGRFALALLILLCCSPFGHTQSSEGVQIQVLDPSGALVEGARVTLVKDGHVFSPHSSVTGTYEFREVPSGQYDLRIDSAGFADYVEHKLVITKGKAERHQAQLTISVEEQHVAVQSQNDGLSTNSSENGSATVLKRNDLEALSDDPNELLNELQALAGPAAGPNGGEIYVDGFTGGQLPPKRSIREIRVNQNPFSAEFDKIGYGRIEIFTNPATGPLHGHFLMSGNDSAWNTANPLTPLQPSYYSYFMQGSVSGPLTKNSSFLLSGLDVKRQNQNVIDAINPIDITQSFTALFQNPSNFFYLNPRVDIKVRNGGTLSIEDSLYHATAQGRDVGALRLAEQAFDTDYGENSFEVHNSTVLNSHLVNETQFRWRRIRNTQQPQNLSPTVIVQGAFTNGGSNAGTVEDHQDIFELQNYATTSAGNHLLRFGVRARAYKDTNYSTAGSNGAYVFNSVAQYQAKTPAQYQVNQINNPTVHTVLFDGAAFLQDEWKTHRNLDINLGLRFEGQNHISDHADFAPRFAVNWAPWAGNNGAAKTVLHVGYGWFYTRFIGPTSLSSTTGTPYIIQALHNNGSNQENLVVNNPPFFDPSFVVPITGGSPGSTTTPYRYTVSPRFHAALDMQTGIGVDQKLGKQTTISVTYINTRGIHQYLTNNITAPAFDPTTYTLSAIQPKEYNYQFQSEGTYKQNQLVVIGDTRFKRLSFHVLYTLNDAKSDTQNVAFFPSVAQNPSLDYGRAAFAVRNQLVATGTYSAPHGVLIGTYLAAQSGTPYNITTGSDFTGNNQFNARPTYGTCGSPDVVATQYGCLDATPVGKGEKIIPYNLGTGPANFIFNLRLSKTINFETHTFLSRSTSQGSAPSPQPKTRPRYSLTLTASASNLFNVVNLGAPNGTLSSPLFGRSQTLATGQYSTSSPGNRSISMQAFFNF